MWKSVLILEVLWWVVTAIVAVAVVLPAVQVAEGYLFVRANVVFVVAFITFSRYIFLLRHTFLARRQRLKAGLFFVFIPVVFLLVQELNGFQSYLDNYGFVPMLGHLSLQSFNAYSRYIYNEMLFFGVGAILSGIVLPFRLLISVWRVRNRGSV